MNLRPVFCGANLWSWFPRFVFRCTSRRVERSIFARQKDVIFLRSDTWISVSSPENYFCCGTFRSDLSRICINTTKGSRSITIRIFGCQKIFFRRVISKHFQKSAVLQCRCYNFSPVKRLGINNILVDRTPRSWAACCDILCHDFFWQVFLWKKLEIVQLFRNRFDNPHCPLHFLNLTLIFYKRLRRIRLLFTEPHWQSRNRLGPKSLEDETFLRQLFWRKQLETQDFGGQLKLCWNLLPKIPCLASQCHLGDGIWSVGCNQFSAERIFISRLIFGHSLEKRLSKKFQISGVQHLSKCCESHAMNNGLGNVYGSGYDENFNSDRFLIIDWLT